MQDNGIEEMQAGSTRQSDETGDPDDVENEYGDAVDAESGVFLGRPNSRPPM